MRITIEIPMLQEIVSQGCSVPLARRGTRWESKCLGSDGKAVGVYAIHHGGELEYVGKTNGRTMNFATRLRREFHETAAGGKHIYPKLSLLTVPPEIKVTLFTKDQIDTLVSVEDGKLTLWQKVEIFETAMIQTLYPSLQLHHWNRLANHVVAHYPPREIEKALAAIRPKQH